MRRCALVLVGLLSLCSVLAVPFFACTLVFAQTEVETFASVRVEPNPAQYNQDPVYVSIRVEPAPPTPDDKFENISVTFTRPDGDTIQNYYNSNPDGIYKFGIYMSMAGNWTIKMSFPGQTFTNGTIHYLPCENQTIFTRLPEPSPTPPPWSTVGTWTTKALMPTPRGGLGVAVVDNKIYAIGGSTVRGGGGTRNGPLLTTGEVVGKTNEYDPATNKWNFKAPMPIPTSHFGIAVYQNKIYCISNGVNEVYDPATDSWETKTPLPIALDAMQANVVDDKIYLIGYASGNSSSGSSRMPLTKVYDPTTDSWTTEAHIPVPTSAYVSTVLDDKIYVMGSAFSNPSSNLNQIYDPQTDNWSQGAPLPSGDMYGAIAVATTGEMAPKRIYVISRAAASNQIYDPKTDSWTNGANLPTSRLNFGIGVVNDTLYVIGGQTFSYPDMPFSYPYGPTVTPHSTNEQYTPDSYGTPDPTYQVPTPTPSSSPAPLLIPTPTVTLPTSNPTPTIVPTQQPTIAPTQLTSPMPSVHDNDESNLSTITSIVIIVVAGITVALGALIYIRKRK